MRTLLVLPVLLIANGCSNLLCTNREVIALPSPNGDHRVTLFMRECGATTDFSTQVSIDPGFLEEIGNTFVADSYNGGVRGSWGGPWVEVKWTGPDELRVRYDDQARIFTSNSSVNGVRISYEPVHAPDGA